jgi:hypothetical protein
VAAHRSRDQLEQRRLMMEDWGRYCGKVQADTGRMASAVSQFSALVQIGQLCPVLHGLRSMQPAANWR